MTIRHWLLLGFACAAACGDDSNNRSIQDAPNADVDASLDDATPPTPTKVTVKLAVAEAAIPVYFQNADGSLVAKAMTDANGEATATMDPGGFATVVYSNAAAPTQYQLFTWGGVKPGDVLAFAPTNSDGTGSATEVTMKVKIPVATGAGQYEIRQSCGGASQDGSASNGSFTATLTTTCAKLDVMVLAKTNASTLISSFTAADVTVAANTTVDLTGNTYAASTTQAITISHNPASGVFGTTNLYSKNGGPRGPLYLVDYTFGASEPVTSTQPMPALPAVHRNVTVLETTTATTNRFFYSWGADGAIAVDWTADVTPEFTAPATFDGTGKVTLGVGTAGAAGQAFLTETELTRTGYTVDWKIVGGSKVVAIPTLPTDVANFALASGDVFDHQSVANYGAGYDAIRPIIGLGALTTDSTATGKLTYSDYASATFRAKRSKMRNQRR